MKRVLQMLSIVVVAAVFVTLAAPLDAGAQTLRESVQSVALRRTAQQLPLALHPLPHRPRAVSSSLKSPRKSSAATKASIAGLAAIGGLFAGGFAGAAIESKVAPGGDAGLQGFFIGAPIGAVVGGIAGFCLTR